MAAGIAQRQPQGQRDAQQRRAAFEVGHFLPLRLAANLRVRDADRLPGGAGDIEAQGIGTAALAQLSGADDLLDEKPTAARAARRSRTGFFHGIPSFAGPDTAYDLPHAKVRIEWMSYGLQAVKHF